MKLTDLLSIEEWTEFEKEITKISGLNAGVYNTDGVRITGHKTWPNKLCPTVNEDEKGRSFICAPAYQNMAAMVSETREGVCDECDAGLARIVVPIFVGDEFVGTAGGCGLLLEDGEVETFMIEKTMGIPEDEAESLAEGIGVIDEALIEKTMDFITKRIEEIVSNHQA